MALSYIRQLYSLDTLDTRFVVPATAPPKEALDDAKVDPANPLPVSTGKDKTSNGTDHVQPPRWRTNEFYFYYLSISVSVFFMFKLVIDCSKGPLFTAVTGFGLTAGRVASKLLQILPLAVRRLDSWSQSRKYAPVTCVPD